MYPTDDPKNYEPAQEFPIELLEWVVKTVKALNEVGTLDMGYGVYGLPDVLPIVFDEEYTTGLTIARSEFSSEYTVWTTQYVDPEVNS